MADGSQVGPADQRQQRERADLRRLDQLDGVPVQARVKPLSFGSGGVVGLLARASGSTKFYRLALMPGNQVQLQAVNGSSVTVIGGASRTVSTGTWYTLAIEVDGTSVRGTVDGTLVAAGTSSVSNAGRIGLQTLYSTASFDDVVVTTGGTPPTTPTTTTPGTTTHDDDHHDHEPAAHDDHDPDHDTATVGHADRRDQRQRRQRRHARPAAADHPARARPRAGRVAPSPSAVARTRPASPSRSSRTARSRSRSR